MQKMPQLGKCFAEWFPRIKEQTELWDQAWIHWGGEGVAHPPRRSYGRGSGAQPPRFLDVFRAFHAFYTPRKIQLDPCLVGTSQDMIQRWQPEMQFCIRQEIAE